MATSPSEKWENGVLVERNIETNRWKIMPDGSTVEQADAGAEEKAVKPARAQNKSVKQADSK